MFARLVSEDSHDISEFSVGDVWIANYPYDDGSESPSDLHPCVILKNDVGESYVLSIRTTHAEEVTGGYNERYELPVLGIDSAGLEGNSYFVLDSVRLVSLDRFKYKIGTIFAWDWMALRNKLPSLSLPPGVGEAQTKLFNSGLRSRLKSSRRKDE